MWRKIIGDEFLDRGQEQLVEPAFALEFNLVLLGFYDSFAIDFRMSTVIGVLFLHGDFVRISVNMIIMVKIRGKPYVRPAIRLRRNTRQIYLAIRLSCPEPFN